MCKDAQERQLPWKTLKALSGFDAILFAGREQRPVSAMHLNTNEEAGGAVHISHGGNGEHVPEGLAALAVIQNTHSCLGARLHSLPDNGNCLGICVWSLQDMPLSLKFQFRNKSPSSQDE